MPKTITMSMVDYVRLTDAASVAVNSGHISSCPGGRRILRGYICTICGRDPTSDREGCGQPLAHVVAHMENGGDKHTIPPYAGEPFLSNTVKQEIADEVAAVFGARRGGK